MRNKDLNTEANTPIQVPLPMRLSYKLGQNQHSAALSAVDFSYIGRKTHQLHSVHLNSIEKLQNAAECNLAQNNKHSILK
ncbi:hypothetical protein D3C87_2022530 [compost metagenome]